MKSDYRISSIITYKCAEGCRLDGLDKRLCQSNGFWQGEAPKCKYLECGPLDIIQHGRVSYTRMDFNATAIYQCNRDYTLVGDEHRYCLGNGSWSGVAPMCFYSHCSQALEIDDGIVSVTNRSINGVATYNCKLGFVLVGNSQQICQLGGTWSGNAPQCKCKYNIYIYIYICRVTCI